MTVQNNAVALAHATFGIHGSSDVDIAQLAADFVFVRLDFSCTLIRTTVSRKAVCRVAINIGWSLGYNFFTVLLATGAVVNARIPPEYTGMDE